MLQNEKKVIATIRKIMPAVVSVMIAKHLEDIEKEIPPELWAQIPHEGQLYPRLPKDMADAHGMVEIGGGSGFIVENDGIVVTNKHVVSDAHAEYTVVGSDGTRYPASVASRDPLNDVAILKVEGTHLPTVLLGDASKLELGQEVLAIGNALGIFRNTVSAGIVSGLSRSIRAQADPDSPPQEMRGLIQTDAAINPGNSGGPLVDMQGKAIGINSATVFGAQSIGFAIPINAARRDLEDLKKYGRIRRPFLGVRYIVIDENLQVKMKLPIGYGALIVRETQHDMAIVPGSPADHAGLKEKDIILECNGTHIDREHPIQDFLESADVGDIFQLTVFRAGTQKKISVTLAELK